MVSYGVLKEEDAQCLKTEFTIKPPSLFLFVAVIVLHLLNTFVMNAVVQYVRDMEENARNALIDNGNVNNLDDLTLLGDIPGSSAIIAAIDPVDVVFTDKFRWFLVGEPISQRLSSASCINISSGDCSADRGNVILINNVTTDERSSNRSNPHSNGYNTDDRLVNFVTQSLN